MKYAMSSCVVGAVVLAAGSAQAVIVDVEYSGTITNFFNTGLLPAELQGLQVGDTWTFSYTIDTDAVVPTGGSTEPGEWTGAGTSNGLVSFTSGLSTISDDVTLTNQYSIDNFPGVVDQVGAWSNNAFGGSGNLWRVWGIGLGLIDSDDIPTDLSLTGPFSSVLVEGVFNTGGENSGVIQGDLRSMTYTSRDIPAPGVGVLAGLGGLVAVRRRRK